MRGGLRRRVLVIALVPSMALALIGASTAAYLVAQGERAQRFGSQSLQITRGSTDLIAGLQNERQSTVAFLAVPSASSGALTRDRGRVDEALVAITSVANDLLSSATPQERAAMNQFTEVVGALATVRKGVDVRKASIDQAFGFYGQLLDATATSLRDIASGAPSGEVGAAYLLSFDAFQAGENVARADALGIVVATAPQLPEALAAEYLRQVQLGQGRLADVAARVPADERAEYASAQTSATGRTRASVEAVLVRRAAAVLGGDTAAGRPQLPVPLDEWQAASRQTTARYVALYLAEANTAARLGRTEGRRTLVTSLVGGLAVLAVALLALGVAVQLTNRLFRRIGRLRADTLTLADVGLPTVVRELRAGRPVDLDAQLPPLDYGKDELGQLADAFSRAQRVAVEATQAEARTREGTRAVFLSIAHRSQVLAHRQLAVLDHAERQLDDPDQLQMLFELDHLATRARRQAENLIVLGGQQPGRQWRRPVPLLEIVRGAVAESEQFAKVSVAPLPELLVHGAAVTDLVHLLAEIVDNATRFSPPQAKVEVRGGLVGRGVVVEVEDRGLGIEPQVLAELNRTLEVPPDFDVLSLSEDSRLGLFVVARLAKRHAIRVTLVESPYGGVRAVVLLPMQLVADESEDDGTGTHALGALPAAAPAAAPGPAAGPAAPERAPYAVPGPPEPAYQEAPAPVGALFTPEPRGAVALAAPPPVGDPLVVDAGRPDAPGDVPAGDPRLARPPLPQRERNAHLAEGLQSVPPGGIDESGFDVEPSVSPDEARNRWAALQRGTAMGRDAFIETEQG
ncbi:MAG: nitrate- and nitrite sensing domain-containing protein [Actinobacteria bacterium]|nr:nitrate- and nitrite sensing domain-containing protein [Actinomycetota bacterium]